MANLKSWSLGIKRQIESQREKIYKRDYKFFNVDRLERIADRIDEFSEHCETCEKLKTDVDDIVHKLPDYLSGSPRKRSEYEKRNDVLVLHLKQEHQLYPHNYFMSIYSLAGFSAGTILGGLTGYLIAENLLFHGVIGGFLIGLFIGYFFGAAKDKQQRNNKLIL